MLKLNKKIISVSLIMAVLLPSFVVQTCHAQGRDTVRLTLATAIAQGLDSSKTLHISQAKIAEAIARFKQARNARLPDITASFTGSEAYILTRTLQINGLMEKPMHLPGHTTLYMGTVSATEPIFAGNQIRLGKESAHLMTKIAKLTSGKDSNDIVMTIIQAYIDLYKLDQSLKITKQELQDIQGRLDETIKFKNQGLATDNDVLRFKLQKAKAELSQIDLENSRAVANYGLSILLGKNTQTYFQVDSLAYHPNRSMSLQNWITNALLARRDVKAYQYRQQLGDINIQKIKDEKLPTLGLGATGYYINPNSQFIPPENAFIVPMTIGLNLSWNISSLYKSKHKIEEARIKRNEIQIARNALTDKIKVDVARQFHDYLKSLKKINVLQTAVAQAKENDRIMELKYQNQLATTTDRIDAQTMLYQSLINLSIARAEAVTAYYQLLKTTGTISNKDVVNNNSFK